MDFDQRCEVVEVFGFNIELNLVNTGFFLGLISSVMIFQVQVPIARNFLGLLIGACFSPVFTTERSDSNRYFFQAFIFIIFTLLVLAGFRWPLIIAFFVLAVSMHGEFESQAILEKINEKEES